MEKNSELEATNRSLEQELSLVIIVHDQSSLLKCKKYNFFIDFENSGDYCWGKIQKHINKKI